MRKLLILTALLAGCTARPLDLGEQRIWCDRFVEVEWRDGACYFTGTER